MTPDAALFRPRQMLILIMVGLTAFIGSAYLMIFGETLISAGQNTFSYSAVGHKAFLETLQHLDIPVSVSRFKSMDKAGPATLLVLAEPDTAAYGLDLLDQVKNEDVVLVVLPKWDGIPDRHHRQWLREALPADERDVRQVLNRLFPGATLTRTGIGAVSDNAFGFAPTIAAAQLIRSKILSPIVAYDGGILLGEAKVGRAKVWVLSDPDILSNAGLGKGDNAELAVAMIRSLLPTGGSVMFDETIHGFEQPPNLLRTALELPFVTASIALVIAILTAILAGITRLGAPVADELPLSAGRETLLRNVAELLEYGRGTGAVLVRYPQLIVADVAQRLNVPKSLDEAGQIKWLDQRARKLGLPHNASDLLARGADLAHALDHGRSAASLGQMANQWKQEMLHGTRRRPVD